MSDTTKRGGRSRFFTGLAILVLLGGAGLGYWLLHRNKGNPSPGPAQARAELDPVRRYLPDNLTLLLRVRVQDVLGSKTVQELEHAMPGVRQEWIQQEGPFEEEGGLENLNTVYEAYGPKGRVTICLTRKPLSRDELLANRRWQGYREVKVGETTLYEMPSLEFLYSSDDVPMFDGTGMGFCVPEPNVLLFGGPVRDLKAILERDRAVELPEGLQAALQATDLSQPIFLVGSFKEIRDKKGLWENDPAFLRSLVASVDYLYGQVALEGKVKASATFVCPSAKAAEEVKKLADRGLVTAKTERAVAPVLLHLLEAVRMTVHESRVSGELELPAGHVARVVRESLREREGPAYEGRPLARLIEDLGSDRAERRRSAAGDLGALGPEARPALPALRRLLKDENGPVRAAAARSLGRMGSEAREALPALVEAAGDREPGVRRASVQALAQVGAWGPGVVPALVQALKDESREVRAAAVTSLSYLGPKASPAVPALLGVLKGNEPNLGCGVPWALGRIGPAAQEAVPALVELVLKDRHGLSASAGVALASIAAGPAPALLKGLTDPDARVRERSAHAIGAWGKRAGPAVPALARALDDRDDGVQTAAAWALGDVGPAARQAVARLIKLVGPGPAAKAAVSGTSNIVPWGNDIQPRRWAAIVALEKLGPAARPAVPTLLKLLSREGLSDNWASGWSWAPQGTWPREEASPPFLSPFLFWPGTPEGATGWDLGPQRAPGRGDGLKAMLPLPIEQGKDGRATMPKWRPETDLFQNMLPFLEQQNIHGVGGAAAGFDQGHIWVAVAKALARIEGKPDEAVARLTQLLKRMKSGDFQKRWAVAALGECGPSAEKALPLLIEILRNKEPLPDEVLFKMPKQRDREAFRDTLKAAALDALARIGPGARAAVPALVQSLRQSRWSDRMPARAALALAAIGPEAREAIPDLIRIVRRQEQPRCPAAAALALARMGPAAKPAVPALEKLARSRRDRMAAAVALWKLDGQVQRPLHIALVTLKSPEEAPEKRLLAVMLLKEMGPKARPAVEALVTARDDPDPEIRRAAAEALQRVDAAAAVRAEKH